MSRTPRAVSLWDPLRQNLGGYFTARARGLLASEFVLLDPDGQEFGRLRGVSGAEFRSGDYSASLEASGRRYRVAIEGQEVLVASPKRRSIDELEISCGGRTYEAQIRLFRNVAVASYPGGERVAHLSGGPMGRSYEILFAAEDGCALPIAIFLLWHVAANRRRAYRTEDLAEGGAMS